mmetsp:Transcript_18764/g.40859  ORF Transcript_18764/g.40859 Transcript_18764/m.40859 type:complete len:567 (-) Transcript_18764:84-1784(-)
MAPVESDIESSSSLRGVEDSLFSASSPTDVLQPDAKFLSLRTQDTQEVDEELVFEAPFDLTEEHLRHVFSTFDTDKDGKIDYDSLKRGLKDWQQQAGVTISVLEGQAFANFVSILDPDTSNDISYEEFAEGYRLLMLRALLPQRTDLSHDVDEDDGAPLVVLDYDATRLVRMEVGAEARSSTLLVRDQTRMTTETEDFFFKRRDGWVKTRWVDVVTTGYSKRAVNLTMKRLAVKYSLHPLALEDVLERNFYRPKVEVFSRHYFLIIPLFDIEDAPISSPGKGAEVGQRRWYHRHNICSRCGTKQKLQWRRAQCSTVKMEMISIFVNVPCNDTLITCSSGSKDVNSGSESATRSTFWQRVQKELEKPYSKLRQYDAQYLTYALLDQSVDLLVPIVKVMKREISDERDFLRRTEYSRGLRRIHQIRQNLESVCRAIKPFVSVLTHVIEDDAICPGVTLYLRDVLDDLECSDDDLRQLIDDCKAVDADADKFQDNQMNRTLYLLTVISAIFLPAQFLTGLWGMNFVDMPELQKSWGYEMFWIIAGVMTFSLLVLFFCFGRGLPRRHEDY